MAASPLSLLIVLVPAALCILPAAAQEQPSAPAAPALTPALKARLIDELLSSMQATYVFPDTARKAAEAIRAHQDAREYDSVTSGEEFARLLTDHLRAVCHDAHLGVRYSPRALPARRRADRPSTEEVARMRHFERFTNAGFTRAERLPGNVGYLEVRGFAEPKAAAGPARAAMDFLADTDALIIDLRRNGGGEPDTVRLLCSYLFDSTPVHLNDIYERRGNRTQEYWTLARLPGKRYLGREVYVLTSKRTASGAEEFCYDLQNLKRATVVGETTWGGANPGDMVRLDDHFSAFIPNGRAINPYTKTNWEGTGITPDVKVPADQALKTAHVAALKTLLAKASAPEQKDLLSRAVDEAERGASDGP